MDDSTEAPAGDTRPEAQLGAELRSARERRGLKLRELADRAHRSHSSLSEYELGHRMATEEVVADYERLLEVPAGTLMAERERAKAARAAFGRDGSLPPDGPPAAPAPARQPDEAPPPPAGEPRRNGRRRVLAAAAGAVVLAAALTLLVLSKDTGPGSRTARSAETGDRVTVDLPPDASVSRCWRFRGTAELTTGRALVLGVENLDNGDPNTYYEAVTLPAGADGQEEWEQPMHFGSVAEQAYALHVLTVPEPELDRVPNRTAETTWSAPGPPPGANLLTTINLHRRAGSGDC